MKILSYIQKQRTVWKTFHDIKVALLRWFPLTYCYYYSYCVNVHWKTAALRTVRRGNGNSIYIQQSQHISLQMNDLVLWNYSLGITGGWKREYRHFHKRKQTHYSEEGVTNQSSKFTLKDFNSALFNPSTDGLCTLLVGHLSIISVINTKWNMLVNKL